MAPDYHDRKAFERSHLLEKGMFNICRRIRSASERPGSVGSYGSAPWFWTRGCSNLGNWPLANGSDEDGACRGRLGPSILKGDPSRLILSPLRLRRWCFSRGVVSFFDEEDGGENSWCMALEFTALVVAPRLRIRTRRFPRSFSLPWRANSSRWE